MSNIFGIGTALTPVGGQQSDSASEIAQRKRQSASSTTRFSTTDETGDQPAPKLGLLQKTRGAAGAAISQLMRRATDRGEPAAADATIEIPPHLERRRAWREAFGLNTWHTQQIAQTEETPISDEARAEAIQAYRSGGRRGRLDLDLAQQVSMTV
jgi:hypothetical protein